MLQLFGQNAGTAELILLAILALFTIAVVDGVESLGPPER